MGDLARLKAQADFVLSNCTDQPPRHIDEVVAPYLRAVAAEWFDTPPDRREAFWQWSRQHALVLGCLNRSSRLLVSILS